MALKDKIRQILEDSFNIERLTVIDDSDKHAGHAEAQKSGGGHFSVLIVSDDFLYKKPLERHRMVNRALEKEIGKEIHALALQTYTLQEFLEKKLG